MSSGRRDGLRTLLGAFRPENESESRRVASLAALLERPDPFTRAAPEHVTASAIVAGVSGDTVLLVYHRKLSRWLQPGGHIEPEDESVFAAAEREVREETGVRSLSAPEADRILDIDIHPIPAWGAEPPHVHFDVRFLFIARDGPPPAADVAWLPFGELPSDDLDGSLSRAAARARRWLSRPVAGIG